MNVNHYCEALNSIQAAWDGREISHANYLQAIAELGHWYYRQDDEEQANGHSPRLVFSEYDSKPEPASLPQPKAKPVAVEANVAQSGDERAAFERYALKSCGPYFDNPEDCLVRDGDSYVYGQVVTSWNAWQARAALATQPATGDPVAHKLVAVQANGEWQEVRGKWKDGAPIAEMLEGVKEGYLRVELAFSAPPAATQPAATHGDEYHADQWWMESLESMASGGTPDQRRAVEVVRRLIERSKTGAIPTSEEVESIGEMCRMLEEGEFAEHAGKGPTADRVESCIVKLLGELSEAHERAEKAEESARVNGVALLAEMDQYLDGFAGNAIYAGSKLHERIKSVLLDPPAASTTSDQYRAELYDEVWTMATRMGYGNVTDALTALANRLTNERAGHKPAAAIDASGDVITERDCVSAEVFATCCRVATPLFYAYARGVPVYQIRQHGTDEWKTVGPNSYDAAANCPDLARRVAYLPLP